MVTNRFDFRTDSEKAGDAAIDQGRYGMTQPFDEHELRGRNRRMRKGDERKDMLVARYIHLRI